MFMLKEENCYYREKSFGIEQLFDNSCWFCFEVSDNVAFNCFFKNEWWMAAYDDCGLSVSVSFLTGSSFFCSFGFSL